MKRDKYTGQRERPGTNIYVHLLHSCTEVLVLSPHSVCLPPFVALQIRCCIRLRALVLEQSLFTGRNVVLLLIIGLIVEDD